MIDLSMFEKEIDELPLDNPFWHYSLDRWENNTIQTCLLRLQDFSGKRVNLLLFAMWLAQEGKPIAQFINSDCELLDTWHNQVAAPLRELRKLLPKMNSLNELRKSVQRSELCAEQIEQALLYQNSRSIEATSAGYRDLMIANLFASGVSESDLILLVQANFPDITSAYISDRLNLLRS